MKPKNELDASQLSEELQLILDLIRLNKNEIPLFLDSASFDDIDWAEFLALSEHHRLYPILYGQLQDLAGNWIPPVVLKSITSLYQQNAFNMLYLSGEMEQVCRLFAQNNIAVLVLKGPVLAAALYGDVSLRTSSDLDVMVSPEKLAEAQWLLESAGYVKLEGEEPILNELKWKSHNTAYIHPDKNVKLELHWKFNHGRVKEPAFAELWERKQQSSLTRFPIFSLSNEDLFFYLISHGAKHGWFRLRWLLDIDRLAKQKINWNQLYRLLQKYQSLPIGGQALYLASELFDAPIARELEPLTNSKKSQSLAKDVLFFLKEKADLCLEPLPLHIDIRYKQYLLESRSYPQKVLLMLGLFYPTREDAKMVPLPEKLHFFYFPLRPFLVAWRKSKKKH